MSFQRFPTVSTYILETGNFFFFPLFYKALLVSCIGNFWETPANSRVSRTVSKRGNSLSRVNTGRAGKVSKFPFIGVETGNF